MFFKQRLQKNMAASNMQPMHKNPFRKYILSLPKAARRPAIQKIAQKCDVTEGYVYAWLCGSRQIQYKYLIPIEEATKKGLRRQQICPELFN